MSGRLAGNCDLGIGDWRLEDGNIPSLTSNLQFLTSKRGFTLIELSVVIVIIGLIVAGIVAGQSLVYQAQLRKVISDANKYISAIETFRLQYDALPGDFNNASSHFADCATDTVVTGNTCNGNGDGDVLYTDGSLREGWRAFEHLHHAGLIQQNLPYLGIKAASGTNLGSVVGENVPEGALSGSGYGMGHTGHPAKYRFTIGAQAANWLPDAALFTHAEAFALDSKVDDGLPHRGYWYSWGNANCFGDGAQITAFDLDLAGANCSLSYNNIKIR